MRSMETVTEGSRPPVSPSPISVSRIAWDRCPDIACGLNPWMWHNPSDLSENLELTRLTCSFYGEELFLNRVPPTQITHPLLHVSNPRTFIFLAKSFLSPCRHIVVLWILRNLGLSSSSLSSSLSIFLFFLSSSSLVTHCTYYSLIIF